MVFGALGTYASLFAAAFLAATVFPAQSELFLAYLLGRGEHNWALLLATATAGNVLGSLVNWWLGRMVERFRGQRWFKISDRSLDRAERWYARWGKWSLLLSWAPFIGDALTLIAGMLRTPLAIFIPLVLVAKAGRYGAIALIVSASYST